MARHLKILEYCLSSLMRRKYKNLALVAVFSVVVAVLASILFLTGALKKEAGELFIDAPQIVVQRIMGGRHDLIPLAWAEKIASIPGVGRVTPRYWGYYFDPISEGNFTLIGVGGEVGALKLLKGAMPAKNGQCAVGKGVADARFTGVGGDVHMSLSRDNSLNLKVVGVFDSASALLTNDLVVLTGEDVVRFFGMPKDSATDLSVEVFNDSETPTIVKKIKLLLPDSRPITRAEIMRTYDAVFQWRSGMTLTMFAGALLAFCILAWDRAAGLSAGEKREIGILKAVGWETADVLELKSWEGAAISLTSFLTGVIMAYVHVFYMGASIFAPALKGWSVLFPKFGLTPHIGLYDVGVIFFLTVAPYTAATVIPSWKAAVTDPDAVMRS
jgi:ABC-type antimicrobial peptide transport system permease subunit